jgi:hypothetical protein
MQKSTITFEGVDYIVRTIDITSLPTFEGESYRSVDVADKALSNELKRRMELGDKYAVRLDEKIFFYPDSEFIRRDPTDEELLDYLREHLCSMTRFKPVSQPEAIDLYAVETNDLGQKHIQLLGYTYEGDNWKTIDVRGVCLPLSEFVEGMEQHEDYVQSLLEQSREYERDVTAEQCVVAINHFFDGEPADYRLRFEDVTMETPVGNYVNS